MPGRRRGVTPRRAIGLRPDALAPTSGGAWSVSAWPWVPCSLPRRMRRPSLLAGITFSDELGGVVLHGGWGSGTSLPTRSCWSRRSTMTARRSWSCAGCAARLGDPRAPAGLRADEDRHQPRPAGPGTASSSSCASGWSRPAPTRTGCPSARRPSAQRAVHGRPLRGPST